MDGSPVTVAKRLTPRLFIPNINPPKIANPAAHLPVFVVGCRKNPDFSGLFIVHILSALAFTSVLCTVRVIMNKRTQMSFLMMTHLFIGNWISIEIVMLMNFTIEAPNAAPTAAAIPAWITDGTHSCKK